MYVSMLLLLLSICIVSALEPWCVCVCFFLKVYTRTHSLCSLSLSFFLFFISFFSFSCCRDCFVVGVLVRGRSMKVVTWNMAGINNNPFEYWSSEEGSRMQKIQQYMEEFVDGQGIGETLKIETIFPPENLSALLEATRKANTQYISWKIDEKVFTYIGTLYDRLQNLTVNQLIKGPDDKTMACMNDTRRFSRPDSVTSNRPTVVNQAKFNPNSWYKDWLTFMFTARSSSPGKTPQPPVLDVQNKKLKALQSAAKSEEKSEDISDEGLWIGTLTDLLMLGIFDATLILGMKKSGVPKWMDCKMGSVEEAKKKKEEKLMQILDGYEKADVIFLQEVSQSIMKILKEKTRETTFRVQTTDQNPESNQMTAVLIKHSLVIPYSLNLLPTKKTLLGTTAVEVKIKGGKGQPDVKYVLASVHSKTEDAYKTVRALKNLALHNSSQRIIIGIDSNANPENGQYTPGVFNYQVTELQLHTGWTNTALKRSYTTYKQRSFIQSQVNKSCTSKETRNVNVGAQNDCCVKDFILWGNVGHNHFNPRLEVSCELANTDTPYVWVGNQLLPTESFPSDHVIVTCEVPDVVESQSDEVIQEAIRRHEAKDWSVRSNLLSLPMLYSSSSVSPGESVSRSDLIRALGISSRFVDHVLAQCADIDGTLEIDSHDNVICHTTVELEGHSVPLTIQLHNLHPFVVPMIKIDNVNVEDYFEKVLGIPLDDSMMSRTRWSVLSTPQTLVKWIQEASADGLTGKLE
jgi:hypothetical protein